MTRGGSPAELRDKKTTAKDPAEVVTPISEGPAFEDIDDQPPPRRGRALQYQSAQASDQN